MICAHCRQEFAPQGKYQRKYCSPRCKNLGGAKLRAIRNAAQSERRCYRCNETKPSEDFPGKTHSYCRSCYNTYQRERASALAPEERRTIRRRAYVQEQASHDLNAKARSYRSGLTSAQLTTLLETQGGACAICHTTEPGGRGTWHFDHDHSCCPGKRARGNCVRGLLCTRCNVGLGNFRDDPDLLIAAAQYLVTTNKISRT